MIHRDAILNTLSTLVAFNTTSDLSNLDLVDWAERHLTSLGFRTERIYDASGCKANLWATIGPEDVPGYILSGHTDVVPVNGQTWTGDPFRLHVQDGRAFGRGACDMKGFLAVCLTLAADMAAARLTAPLHFAFSYDEEIGCRGAPSLVQRIRDLPCRPQACFVGEPTLMSVVIGHKAKRSARATVRGLSCHSSLAPEGVNAVTWGARLVSEIQHISDRLSSEGARDDLYDVPHSTGHVGVFHGGDALNTVPDLAEIMFEFRTLPQDDPNALVDEVVRFATMKLEPQMRERCTDAGFSFNVYAAYPGLDTDPDSLVVRLAKQLAGSNEHTKVAFGTEAGLFDSVAGVPTVVVGPGSIEQAHKADEWIAISELDRCASFIDRLIACCTRTA